MTASAYSRDSPAPAFSRGWLLAFALSLVTSVLIVLPFFWLGTASGHDFEFHAASWLDVASQWKTGVLYPHWTEWTNHGFGEPRYIFYPPFSWMLGAALSFGVPWSQVPVVFILLVQTLAGLSAFALARRMVPGRAALFGAVCYAANPNALLMIYVRSDFAELLACAFFPVLILEAFEIAELLENSRQAPARAIVLFSACFAAVWLSNAPAGVIASYSMALLFAWAALVKKSWQPLVRGTAGIVLGLGLAAFYLVPAAYQQRWVRIAQALSAGLLPSQNFLFTELNDPEHNLFNWIASSLAILLIVITGIAAAAVHRQMARRNGSGPERREWSALLVLSGAATALMLRVTSIFWEHLPKLRFVQFPWRWMSLLAVVFACFLSVVAAKRFGWLWLTAVFALLAGSGIFLVQHTWWDDEEMPTLQAAMTHGDGFEGTDEYDPLGDDHYDLPRNAPRVQILPRNDTDAPGLETRMHIERWTTNEKEIRVTSREPQRLALRLLNYPAWRVKVNDAVIQPERADDFNQMIVPVEAGTSEVRVELMRTPDRTAGIAVTCASLLMAMLLMSIEAIFVYRANGDKS